MIGKFILLLFFIVWGFYIYVAETPITKVYRACLPVSLSTQVFYDGVIKWDYTSAQHVSNSGAILNNWCERGVYQTFYGSPQSVTNTLKSAGSK